MKTKISLLLCALALVTSLTACEYSTKTSESGETAQTSTEQTDTESAETSAQSVLHIDPTTVPVNAETDFVFTEGSDGTALITGYVGTAMQVRIPDTLGGCDKIVIGKDAFTENESITYLYLPQSVTAVGNNAFRMCNGLQEVNMGDSSVTKIGYAAFEFCDELTTVSLPATLKGGEEDGLYGNAFSYCLKLSDLTIVPDGELELVDGVVYDGNTLVLGVPGMMQKELIVRDGTEFIANYAFADIDAFESVTLPNSLLSIGEEAFSGNESIVTLNLGNGVKRIEKYAFNYCDNISPVILPQSVEYLGLGAFRTCHPKTVQLPDSFEMEGSIDQYVFQYAKDAVFSYRGQEYNYDRAAELTVAIRENH